MEELFTDWQNKTAMKLKALKTGCNPKSIIRDLGEGLLSNYSDKPLISKYDVFQHQMDYWEQVMQDDCYLIAQDGWKAQPVRVMETRQGRQVDRGWACDLIPKQLIVARYFAKEQEAILALDSQLASTTARLEELEEENSGEEGYFTS